VAPSHPSQDEVPKFPTIDIGEDQMIKSFLLLRTESTRPIVLETMALQALEGPEATKQH
jgi:hypothetical protein